MDPRGRKSKSLGDLPCPGELVFETGAEAGRRWSLHVPTTFVGSAAGCDLRLVENGIDPFHCLFVAGPEGLTLRDLESSQGTFVNGKRISAIDLKDGDRIRVGPSELSLALHAGNRSGLAVILPTPAKRQHDALRVQVAAVAAQQTCLDEQESRLGEKSEALREEEERAHRRVDEKRLKLQKLHDAAQAERQALLRDQLAYERHIERITSNLSGAQRELLQQQRHVETERVRLAKLLTSLRERYRRMTQEAAERIEKKETDLAAREAKLREGEVLLRDRRIKFSTDRELGRHHLRESWTKLKQAQSKWKHRRGNERAALKVFARDLQEAEIDLHEATQKFDAERQAWEKTKLALEGELKSLDERVRNQRHVLENQREQIAGLDDLVRLRRGVLENSESEAPTPASAKADRELHRLTNLAEELSDQRRMLAEQRHRLGLLQASWQEDRESTVAQLEAMARDLAEMTDAVREREEGCAESEHLLAARKATLSDLRHKIFARNAELKVRESAWEAERDRVLAEVRHREAVAEQSLASLVELRHRWARRRQAELNKLNEDRAALLEVRKKLDRDERQLSKRLTLLEDQKRAQGERQLALEQLRQEIVGRSDTDAERRIERLRRRWLTQNAAVLRTIASERSAMESERRQLDQRFLQLQQETEALTLADSDLQNKILAWENQQAVSQSRQARLESVTHLAEAQKHVLEKQLTQMTEQVERIAKDLLDDNDSPANLDRAA